MLPDLGIMEHRSNLVYLWGLGCRIDLSFRLFSLCCSELWSFYHCGSLDFEALGWVLLVVVTFLAFLFCICWIFLLKICYRYHNKCTFIRGHWRLRLSPFLYLINTSINLLLFHGRSLQLLIRRNIINFLNHFRWFIKLHLITGLILQHHHIQIYIVSCIPFF